MKYNRPARWRLAAAAIAALATLTGCTAPLAPAALDRATGSLTLVATVDVQSVGGVVSAKVIATHEGMRREAVIPVSGSTIAGSIDNLPVGDWTVRLELVDAAGDTTHVAEATVRVYPNQASLAELTAQPVEAQVEIVVDLTGFPGAEAIKNVRVTFTGNRQLTLKPVEGEPLRFSGLRELPPGDYDFNVSLYKETTYAADRVYVSPWAEVRLVPGKTTRVVWQAQTGSAAIEGGVADMPEPPRNLELEIRDGELWLTWEAPQGGPPPAVYRVYRKSDAFEAYKLLAEVAGDVLAHPLGPVAPVPTGAAVAVTAVSAQGIESFRSAPPLLDGSS